MDFVWSPKIFENMNKLLELIDIIKKLPHKHKTLLIAIDGRGGSGKTTLALIIKKSFPEARIITTDDFYNKIIEKIDERLLRKQILEPLSKDLPTKYMEYNGKIRKPRIIEPGGIVIIEGVYAFHSSVSNYYDFKVWINIPLELVNKRVKKRDGYFDKDWNKFHRPKEDKYLKKDSPKSRADLIISNTTNKEEISNLQKLWEEVKS